MKNLEPAITILVLFVVAGSVFATPSEVPAKSLATIQNIFDSVYDNLAIISDGYWHRGQYPEYVRAARFMAELCPSCIEPYTSGAWLMESLERHDESVAFYNLALERNPKNCSLMHDYALFLFRHKKYERAKPILEEAVAEDCSWESWHLLAHCYERLGRKKDSIDVWESILRKWPENETAAINLKRLKD